jgi:hypothetical protein
LVSVCSFIVWAIPEGHMFSKIGLIWGIPAKV